MSQENPILKKSRKHTGSFHTKSIFSVWFLLMLFSCNTHHHSSDKQNIDSTNIKSTAYSLTKPPSIYQDTLTVKSKSAIFYHPDSLQLVKIKRLTDSVVFASTMHEYFYQMRNARLVIKKTWPGLNMIEAKNYRWLSFFKEDSSREYIDLDTKNDAYGLFVFDGKKSPVLIDMTNIETEVSFYLMK